jgi:glycerophosphoryl diester phosphodiesterase
LVLAAGVLGGAAPAGAFDLQGHRGARGLAPENTLAAFRTAIELGVSTLELDVHLSADGVPMVTHDPALNRDIEIGRAHV